MIQPFRSIIEQVGQPPDIGHPRTSVRPGRLDQHMIGFVLAQNVIDKVGAEGDLSPGLALAGVLTLHQPSDYRHLAKGATQEMRILHPVDKFFGQDIR